MTITIHPDWRALQLLVLSAIASDAPLRDLLVLRGGGAQRLFYGGTRITTDLDFVVIGGVRSGEGERSLGRVKQRLNATLNRHLVPRISDQLSECVSQIKIDLAAFETVYDYHWLSLPADLVEASGEAGSEAATVQVCTREDIVAEKLVAMLTAFEPDKTREHDLFDMASVVSSSAGRSMDYHRLAELAMIKGTDRRCRVTPEAFTPDVRNRLQINYDRLRESTGDAFIPFDEAWAIVTSFVRQLPFPPSPRSSISPRGC